MIRISLVCRVFVCASCILFIICCRNQKKSELVKGSPASIIRLDSLLGNSSTKFNGGIHINPGNFEAFEGNGWEIRKDAIAAVNKRTVLILPELPAGVKRASLKFRAGLPQGVSSRGLVINSKNREIASLELKSGLHEYEIDLQADELKKLRFVFDGRKIAGEPFANFTAFKLEFYGNAPVKIGNEVRPATIVPADSTISFTIKIPEGKPVLELGAGSQGMNAENPLMVAIQEGAATKRLAEFTASSTKWHDRRIDLSSFAGKQVRLDLKSSAEKAPNGFVAWSSPEIFDSAAKRPGPNIILFSIDALRPDHLSSFGYPIKTSPNIDTFSGRSIVFTNAYCTSPSTLPSHASILTGLYAGKHQVGKRTKMMPRLQRIPDDLVTLAELAAERDYRTAAITDDGYVSSFYGFQQGFRQYIENNDVEKNEVVTTIDDGIEWLKENKSRPFFLFLHSYEVHEPFTPPLSAFRHLFPQFPLKDGKSPEIYNEWLKDVMIGKIIPTPEEKDLVKKAFDAEIYFFDQQFGRLLKEIEKLDLDQNTILIVFSDHGQQFFDRGNGFGHANSLFVEEIKVPLIIHVPGKSHQQIQAPVSLVDIYPTVADLIGAKKHPVVDGINLLHPADKQPENRAVYYEIHYADKALWGMQNHEYKLIVDSVDGDFFFDIRKDPKETRNLKNLSPRAMSIMQDLLATYIAHSTAPSKFQDKHLEREEASELTEKLRALGYLN